MLLPLHSTRRLALVHLLLNMIPRQDVRRTTFIMPRCAITARFLFAEQARSGELQLSLKTEKGATHLSITSERFLDSLTCLLQAILEHLPPLRGGVVGIGRCWLLLQARMVQSTSVPLLVSLAW